MQIQSPERFLNQDIFQGQAELAAPRPSLLADYLRHRLESERNPSLSAGPVMPAIGMKALMLYANRKSVESYPLIYTTLALAHQN